jgi:tetratricopeptide (TPR) repeat protein
MTVWLIADWAADWNKSRQVPARWLAIPAVCCLLALACLTYRQVGYLHDTEALWRRALALTQDNYIAQGALAGVLHKQGKTEEAIEHIRAALAIRPDDWPANLILAAYEQSQGDTAAATARYQMVALRASKPSQRAAAYNDLGTAYRQTGDLLRAKEAFEQSLRLVPSQPMLMVTLGLIAQKNGDLPEAVRQYSSAFELQHSDVRALLLAQALRLEGRVDEADAMSRRAARASGNLAEAQKTVDSLLAGK